MSRVEGLANLPLEAAVQIDETCDRFESAFRAGAHPRIEDFLSDSTEPVRSTLFAELLKLEVQLHWKVGSDQTVVGNDYVVRFPEFRDLIASALATLAEVAHVEHRRSPEPKPGIAVGSPADLVLPCRLGNYLVESKIGHGGMGTVYRAIHVPLERPVALKLMQRDRMLKPEAVTRFQREMKAVGLMRHPNIVLAYDAGEVEGMRFLAMEHVSGWDLASVCRCYGKLPIPVACECIRQAARGLQHVCESGLVHRDIKPSNLMLTVDGEVKLLDLGLARLRENDQDERITNDSPMGTMEYISPEQARSPHDVDIRADLYSLGCTLFKLIAGHSPFARPPKNSVQLLSAHLESQPPSIRDCRDGVPRGLDDLIEWMLRKNPADRPQSPAEVIAALKPFASDRILKSFACAVKEITDNTGKLPDVAPPGSGTETDRWESPPDVAEIDEAPADAISAAPPADEPAVNSGRNGPSAALTRRRWLTAAAALIALVAGLYIATTRSSTSLLARIDLKKDSLVGQWRRDPQGITSPPSDPGVLRLGELTAADYQLDLTATLQSGTMNWSLVSTSKPRFAVEFGVTVISGNDQDANADAIAPPNWRLAWDPAEEAPQQIRVIVHNQRLLLTRDSHVEIDATIPDGPLSRLLPKEAEQHPGLYVLTDNSTLRISEARLTLLPTKQSPHK